MPKLIIDHTEVEVPAGTNVLDAAKQAGVWIPHFCYHPALGKAGACRLCAVMFLEGPVKGLQMSCMIPAQDGMVVSTTDGEAAQMRTMVMEWLMINHPHDCPVCDEGGECLLQDYTIAGGHSVRRYSGKKRTHVNQQLGPQIEHEMNRCIQCYRCVRFYQEFAGGSDFGVMGSGSKVYFGRFKNGTLESPFSGNLVDLCPTGVFTDKTARFRARYWDYQMAPSVCPHCSLGCNTTPVAHYRELLKTTARHNDAINGWFICDRGRFSTAAVNDPTRPRTPLVDGNETSWDQALESLVNRLLEVRELYGPASIALVGSPRASMEANLLLTLLADAIGTESLCYFIDSAEAECTATAIQLLTPDTTASMADLQQADCIALVACDLLEEGPMMALAVRQAWRNGAQVFVVGAITSGLPFDYTLLDALEQVPLSAATQPVIVCSATRATLATIRDCGRFNTRLAFLFSGPNSFGAGLLATQQQTLSLSDLISTGKVKALISLEADIPSALLQDLQLIITADWLPTVASQSAAILLPTTAWVEMEGIYLNNEGRAQRFQQVMQPGLPLREADDGHHPSHNFRQTAPGSDPLPAWQIIANLIEQLGGEKITRPLNGPWESLRELDAETEGIRVAIR